MPALRGGVAYRTALLHAANNNAAGSASSSAVTTPADVPTLVTAVGLTPTAFWDVRGGTGYGLVLSGSSVTTVNDVRGVASFPSNDLVGVGSRQPVWDGTTVNFDGVDDVLATALLASLDLSVNLTVTLVLSAPSGTAGNFFAVVRNAAATRWLSIRLAAAGGLYQGRALDSTGSALNFPANAAYDATVRALIVGNKNSPREYEVQVPNVALSTTVPGGTMSSESYQLCLGAFSDTGTTPVPIKWRAAAVWPGYLSAAQINLWRDWAIANHAAVAA